MATHVTKAYNKRDPPAVRGVTFGIQHGEIFGLLGPNGAGKSSTFNILVQVLQKSSGKVNLDGYETPHPEVNSQVSTTHVRSAIAHKRTFS